MYNPFGMSEQEFINYYRNTWKAAYDAMKWAMMHRAMPDEQLDYIKAKMNEYIDCADWENEKSLARGLFKAAMDEVERYHFPVE